jgi:hypothetical protein
MEYKTDENVADYARCVLRLKKREAEDGLMRQRKSRLIRDYSLPKYDNDPDVLEYRQLRVVREASDKNAADYAQCVKRLREREAKDGLRTNRESRLIRDYFLPQYDNDPDAREYRQLMAESKARNNKNGTDEDPVDPAENQLAGATGTLKPWFDGNYGDGER